MTSLLERFKKIMYADYICSTNIINLLKVKEKNLCPCFGLVFSVG